MHSPSFDDLLSSLLGWVSIACWVVVYSPQIYENYSLKSGEGLSIVFVYVWFLGDVTNTVGAAIAGLLPTMIILGIYYVLCDIVLVFQVYYYRRKSSRSQASISNEETPLLQHNREPERVTSTRVLVLRYTGTLVVLIVTGLSAWWICSNNYLVIKPENRESAMNWTIQILGWTSAVCYLGSRVPQITKNLTTRCKGLAPALFFFSILGNATYSLSICVKSMEREYLWTNASWLAGSVLTIVLDVIVLLQFWYFRYKAFEAR